MVLELTLVEVQALQQDAPLNSIKIKAIEAEAQLQTRVREAAERQNLGQRPDQMGSGSLPGVPARSCR